MRFNSIGKEYLKSKEWKTKNAEYSSISKHTCWACNVVDSSCAMHHKNLVTYRKEKLDDLVCLCSDCFKSVTRMQFLESDFLLMCHYLKQQMNKNDHNGIFTYSQVKDFKEQYLQDKIKEFKQTLDPELQFDLIQKVLTLPIR